MAQLVAAATGLVALDLSNTELGDAGGWRGEQGSGAWREREKKE